MFLRKLVISFVLLVVLVPSVASADWERTLVPDSANPVFDPATRAYYSTVLYDADGFGGGDAGPFYRIWYSDGGGISTAESDDGIAWSGETACAGLTNPHHSKVIYDADGFGNGAAGPFYKMWYWDTANLYDIAAIRHAESNDGVNWVSDQALTQDACPDCIIDNSMPVKWNRGSYGPVFILYNANASDAGTNPFDYSYAMYYDGTTGGFEQTGLGYSANGTHWTIADPDPVLPSGSDWTGAWGLPDPWDSSYTAFGTVIRDPDGLWHFWYSGGTTAVYEGIGHATSSDGIAWVRDEDNPFVVPVDGTWMGVRAYTPSVIFDEDRFSGHGDNSRFKMWITGRDVGGNYAVGYYGRSVATLAVELGENSKASQDVLEGTTEVVISQLKLTNDDVEDVDVSLLVENLVGALLDRGAVDTVSIYHDVEGNGELDAGTDELLGSAAASSEASIALDTTIDMNAVVYWLVVVELNDTAVAGDDLIASLESADDVDAVGLETGEIVMLLDGPFEGSILMNAKPGPDPGPVPPGPEPDPNWHATGGGGGCVCTFAGNASAGNSAGILLLALPFLAPIVWRLRKRRS